MRSLGIARLGVWKNLLQVRRKGYRGNRKGEGFILGGLYVIGPQNQVMYSNNFIIHDLLLNIQIHFRYK